MKEVRIYHRKELVKRLRLMIAFAGTKHTYIAFPDSPYDLHHVDARSIRQFRNQYNIYECF